MGKSLVGEGLREEFGFQIAAHENADTFTLGLRVKLAGVAGDELRLCALTVADLFTAQQEKAIVDVAGVDGGGELFQGDMEHAVGIVVEEVEEISGASIVVGKVEHTPLA